MSVVACKLQKDMGYLCSKMAKKMVGVTFIPTDDSLFEPTAFNKKQKRENLLRVIEKYPLPSNEYMPVIFQFFPRNMGVISFFAVREASGQTVLPAFLPEK